MKVSEVLSIADGQRDALEVKARTVLATFPFAEPGEGRPVVGVEEQEDVRELAELALSTAHHWKLESNARTKSSGDVVGTAIGYALLAVVLVALGLLAVCARPRSPLAAWRSLSAQRRVQIPVGRSCLRDDR